MEGRNDKERTPRGASLGPNWLDIGRAIMSPGRFRFITALFTIECCVLPSAIGYPDDRPDTQGIIVMEEICAGAMRADLAGALNIKACQSLHAAGKIAFPARSH
jgi:hypothetical protein